MIPSHAYSYIASDFVEAISTHLRLRRLFTRLRLPSIREPLVLDLIYTRHLDQQIVNEILTTSAMRNAERALPPPWSATSLPSRQNSYHSSSTLLYSNSIDVIIRVPYDLLLLIFAYLDERTCGICALTCRSWFNVSINGDTCRACAHCSGRFRHSLP